MDTPTTCFLVVPLDVARESLRRYASGECSANGYPLHQASVVIGERLFRGRSNGHGADDVSHDDPRWPQECPCDYVFRDDDSWQHNLDRLHARADDRGGERFLLRDAPVGAMWDTPWCLPHWQGPDGRCLIVKLPDGSEWCVDGPATNGPGWTRTGDPPRITARPSIGSAGYHGWLTDGVLSADIEGRT